MDTVMSNKEVTKWNRARKVTSSVKLGIEIIKNNTINAGLYTVQTVWAKKWHIVAGIAVVAGIVFTPNRFRLHD